MKTSFKLGMSLTDQTPAADPAAGRPFSPGTALFDDGRVRVVVDSLRERPGMTGRDFVVTFVVTVSGTVVTADVAAALHDHVTRGTHAVVAEGVGDAAVTRDELERLVASAVDNANTPRHVVLVFDRAYGEDELIAVLAQSGFRRDTRGPLNLDPGTGIAIAGLIVSVAQLAVAIMDHVKKKRTEREGRSGSEGPPIHVKRPDGRLDVLPTRSTEQIAADLERMTRMLPADDQS